MFVLCNKHKTPKAESWVFFGMLAWFLAGGVGSETRELAHVTNSLRS